VLEAVRKKAALRAAMSEEDAAQAIEIRRAEREARADIHQAWLDALVHVAPSKRRPAPRRRRGVAGPGHGQDGEPEDGQ